MSSLAQSIISYLTEFDGPTAYAAILGMLLLCGLGVPLPEDITLIAAGILAAVGSISMPGAIIAGFVGVMAGDAFMFYLGRIYGRHAFELPIIRSILTPRRVAMAERKVLRNSKFICFTARFLPGLRSPIFLTAGMMGVRPVIFFGLDGFAALISVPVWVFVGHWFGENFDTALKFAERIQISLLIAVVVLVVGYFWYRRAKKNRRAAKIMRRMSNKNYDPHLNPK